MVDFDVSPDDDDDDWDDEDGYEHEWVDLREPGWEYALVDTYNDEVHYCVSQDEDYAEFRIWDKLELAFRMVEWLKSDAVLDEGDAHKVAKALKSVLDDIDKELEDE